MKTRLRHLLSLVFCIYVLGLSLAPAAEAFFNVLMMKKRTAATCDTANSGMVQSADRFTDSSAQKLSYYSAQTAGNLNVVVIGWSTNTAGTVTSVSDTAGNTYSLAIGPIRSSNTNLYIYYAKNIVSSAAGNLVTVNLSASFGVWVAIMEYSGIDTASPLDGTASGNTAATAITTSSLTTTHACNVLLSATYTDGTGLQTGSNFWFRTGGWGDFVQDRVVSTTGSYSASATQDSAAAQTTGLIALKKSSGTQALSSIRNIQWNSTPGYGTHNTFTSYFMSAQTAGNMNVVVLAWNTSTGNVTSVTDSAGNTYTLAGSVVRGTNLSQAVYYAKNISSYAAGNLVTVNTDSNLTATIQILEYKGLSTTSPLDQVAGTSGASMTPTSSSVTTTYANELILGITNFQNSTTYVNKAGSGFVVRSMDGVTPQAFVQEKVVSATGTYSSSSTSDTPMAWISQIVTFH